MKTVSKEAVVAESRSQVYAFLSLAYRQEPTLKLLQALNQPGLKTAFSSCGFEPRLEIAQGFEGLLEELAVEYARLFLGPGPHISPHESVWAPEGHRGNLWGPETAEVKRFIEASGLNLDSTRLIPDHISVELEFMQRLADKEREAWEKENNALAMECLKGGDKFLREHLCLWFPHFAVQVREAAKLSFYKQLTDLAEGFIRFDAESVAERLVKNIR